MIKDLVTIIIPTYNMSAFTVKAVESIFNQTYQPIEIIVVDDGSTDDTQEVMAPLSDRLQYIYKENGGTCSARNVGLKKAQGEFIGMMDSDDMYMPDKVKDCVEFLKANPGYGLVHTDAYLIDAQDRVIGKSVHPDRQRCQGWIKEKLILMNFICNATIFLRKEAIDKVGLYDESIFPPADWDMWLRISEHFQIGHIDKPLSEYRVISNSCFSDLERTRTEMQIVLDKFFARNPDTAVGVKRRALSNYHLSMAQCYFLKDNYARMKEEFLAALKSDPFSFKVYGIYLYYLVAKNRLKQRLRKKIVIKDEIESLKHA